MHAKRQPPTAKCPTTQSPVVFAFDSGSSCCLLLGLGPSWTLPANPSPKPLANWCPVAPLWTPPFKSKLAPKLLENFPRFWGLQKVPVQKNTHTCGFNPHDTDHFGVNMLG